MAKLYKVRKKCLICRKVFYPKYAGSLYCEECKNRKNAEKAMGSKKKKAVVKKSPVKKPVSKKSAVKKTTKKKPATKKGSS